MLWQELISEATEGVEQEVFDALAERINACLTEKFEVIQDRQTDLIAALGAYHHTLASVSSADVAYIEILLRASKDVAQFLREHKEEVLAAAVEAEDTEPDDKPEDMQTEHS